MSETEKPLHVRVAEALGWTDWISWDRDRSHDIGAPNDDGAFPSVHPREPERIWEGIPPGEHSCPYAYDGEPCECCRHKKVHRYDTDWSVTGPLIERFKISLEAEWVGSDGQKWMSYTGSHSPTRQAGIFAPTPLLAVCNLILALHEAGRLPK